MVLILSELKLKVTNIKNSKKEFIFRYFLLFTGAFLLTISCVTFSQAQLTIVKGRVTDAISGEGMPFVTIYFKNTTIGTNSDFEGYFSLKSQVVSDSLVSSNVGYKTRTKSIKKGESQVINFQLEPDLIALQEFVVVPGENPAWAIMREVIKNKEKNDKRNLSAYEYESYSKIEIDVDNISNSLKKRKVYKKIAQVMDSVQRMAGEDGKPILPIFISETISNVYYRSNPDRKKEKILKTKLTGVGIQDGTLVAQVVGSSFQEYNFYKNYLLIVEKEFASPLADGWRAYYNYSLKDSLFVGDHFCYKIDVKPKRAQDLAFYGTIWISQANYALKQIDVSITENANLNFVEKIKVQQELEPTESGAWLPSKSRVVIDIQEPNKQLAGLIAKFYSSNKDIIVNKPRAVKFFDTPVEVAEDAFLPKANYWNEHRHDSLTPIEKNVYIMIDSLRQIPVVKTYMDIINIAINGYKRVGKIDVGPYIFAYGYNNIEGHRVRLGFKTNINFSDKWILKGYGAYGTLDRQFKYSGSVDYIFDRKPWTMAGIRHAYDLEQVGLMTEEIYDNSLFYTSSRWGTLRRPFLMEETRAYFQTDVFKGYTQMVGLRVRDYQTLFPFEYLTNPPKDTISRNKNFQTSELVFEARFTKKELFVQNDNERIGLGTDNWPVITLRYNMGIKGLAGSDFNYHKFNVKVSQNIRLGYIGSSTYILNLGYIPSKLPYQLLQVHLGNETLFYTNLSFNLMRFFEFVSDRYASLNYTHRFEGLFFNSVPLIKKLNWRLLVTGNFLYGSLRNSNFNLIPKTDLNGSDLVSFESLNQHIPYVELGYGIENIFKFIRVDAIHRINYLDKPDVKRFGVKISAQFRL